MKRHISLGLILVLSVILVGKLAITEAAPAFEQHPASFQTLPKFGLDGAYDPKRSGSRGFHEGIFDFDGFGGFSTVKKRIPEMTSRGMNGDAFTATGAAGKDKLRGGADDPESGGKRIFYSPIKKLLSQYMLHKRMPIHKRIPIHKRRPADFMIHKRMSDMGVNGFHGDTFTDGFGEFNPTKRMLGGDAFHSDTFSDGFGEFSPSKRMIGGDAFHSDAFSDGFGDFSTTKKRFDGGAQGFHEDAFTDGFGQFNPTKRTLGDDAFHSDAFSDGFGDFSPSKRSFGDDAFHRDTFTNGFGEFSASKRAFGNDAFHSDTFSDGFGGFETL